ncbi:TMEM175 family protein, partial [Pseudonocardia pini]|uniref:TMEM175 family protein n=1 Tax=Pseudonocardia pini TaxID=2758030 RepID=UPI0015EFE35A
WGATDVFVVAGSPTLAVRAAVAADPALHLVTDGDPPEAELYVLTGDTGYHGTRRNLERVLVEAPDAVVLVANLLWPAGRRDVLPGVGTEGPSIHRDGLTPAGVGAGSVDAAEEAGGEENGVLTAVEDVLAEAAESWTLGLVPVLGGLGVLARDGAAFAEELWETLLPWTTSELLAGLERNRVALLSRVLDLDPAPAQRAEQVRELGALLGFAVIGRFWLAHHALFDRIRVVDRPLLLLNLLLLAPVALVPAVAGLIADYGDRTPAVVLYAAVVAVAAGAQLGVWLWASHGNRLTAEPEPEDDSPRRTTAGLALACGAFAVSVPLAFVSTWAAQACWLVALLPARWWLRWPGTGRSRAAGPGRRTRG